MADLWLLAVLLGLPYLTSQDVWLVVGATGWLLGCCLVYIGARAWAEHRWPADQPLADADTVEYPRLYRGRRRRGWRVARPRTPRGRRRLRLAVATAADLNRRAVAESMRRLNQARAWTGRSGQRKGADRG